jgi:peptidoglycan hydrolase-like protein with peptidoglycan-binding domain
VTKQKVVAESTMEWRPLICETNITGSFVLELQKAPEAKGHNPGPIDGICGSQTQSAVRAFQKANGLATGGLTYKTVEKPGLRG